MSSTLSPGAAEPETSHPPASRGRFWLWVGVAAAGWLAYVLSLEIRNPRLIASWHGFLHTAIANRFPGPGWTPENPFFAGEPLKYYWVFHRIAAGLGELLHIDPLTSLRLLTLMGLVMLVMTAALLGRRLYHSTGAGILIGTLALIGLNPLGPAIAEARHLTKGVTLFEEEVGGRSVETVFASNELADQLMSRNLLPSMYFSTDWRQGQNIVWFFDISSRGIAIGVMMALLLLLLQPTPRLPHLAAVTLLTALLAALNPIVGIAVAGALGFGYLLLDWLARRDGHAIHLEHLPVVIALGAGVILAAPTFLQLFGQGGGATSLAPLGKIPVRLMNLVVNFVVLAPLAWWSLRRASAERKFPIVVPAIAGGVLLLGALLAHLEEGNEHNLVNAAMVVLAVPAVGALVFDKRGQRRPETAITRRLWITGLLFLPVTIGTWLGFDGRPRLPFSVDHARLARTPANSPLAGLYRWIDGQTGRDAVFIVNPARPVKMSGNVSELPAFTGRTLFTDQPSYLTTAYPDATLRAGLAGRLVAGEETTSEERSYLERLQRALYIVSYEPARMARLTERYGPPVFRQGYVAVYHLSVPRDPTFQQPGT